MKWLCWLLWLMLPTMAAANDALIMAAARSNVAELRKLLDTGVAVNQRDAVNTRDAVNARDARGRNAVLAATQGGHVEAARLLISRGADVNAQDDIRDSAFLLAGARSHTEIVRAAGRRRRSSQHQALRRHRVNPRVSLRTRGNRARAAGFGDRRQSH